MASGKISTSAGFKIMAAGLLSSWFLAASPAFAQRLAPVGGVGPSTTFRPGSYQHLGGNVHYNREGGSLYVPNVGVLKDSGVYRPAGNGYYRNPHTGNIYNPNTGSYTKGKTLSFDPGKYDQVAPGAFHNRTTNSLHLPGRAVIRGSGVYTPIGGGYYRNESSGNVYNPTTGAYKKR